MTIASGANVGLTVFQQQQQHRQLESNYQQQAVDLINHYLEQQQQFVTEMAKQPAEILVGSIAGAKVVQVVMTGAEVPKELSFSHQDILRRAIANKGKIAPEVSFINKQAAIDFVQPLANGSGVVLVSVPFSGLEKNLETLVKQGISIDLSQTINKEKLPIYSKTTVDVSANPKLSLTGAEWELRVEVPAAPSPLLTILSALVAILGAGVGLWLLGRKFTQAAEQDNTAILAFLQNRQTYPALNFSHSQLLVEALAKYNPPPVSLSQKAEDKAVVNVNEVAAIVNGTLLEDQKQTVALSKDAVLDLELPQEVVASADEPVKEQTPLEFSVGHKTDIKDDNTVPKHIFRAYDIRGKAHIELSKTLAKQIGLAIGSEARARGEQTILVGRDVRLSSQELSKALVDGLQESGCDVIDVGQVPTPVLYYAAKKLGTGSGVMVTASHNPAPDNGFKVMLAHHTLVDTEIMALRQRILDKDFSKGAGAYTERYITDAYLQDVNDDVILARNFNVVIDAGNGVAGPLAVKLFESLGCTVSALYCDPDGNFPNHDPDPTKAENLDDLLSDVAISGADVGIALDGDGDRVVIVTNSTKVVASDRLLMLFAKEILATQPGADILYDVKCSRDLVTVITQNGGRPVMTKTGHSWLKAAIQETNAPLAGEMSGHFIFNDRWGGFDDGLYAAARFLEILANTYDATADDLFKQFPVRVSTPEIHIPIAEDHKAVLMERLVNDYHDIPNAVVNTTDGLRVEFPDAWGLIRASNTGAHLVARFEANDEEALATIKDFFKRLLQQAEPMLLMTF
ncbi:phosphomannomutase/phosphoglucomutase [Agitococcus lubricus]|uniref:phosphomannomutase/phosphoglucomutase n=1 Tax=Agitococcus lubricus TaxID=1077255 RepID=UPI0014743F12|nr:phosphomannomutase/phosphoglucomutase [Agitococcus lubricus]